MMARLSLALSVILVQLCAGGQWTLGVRSAVLTAANEVQCQALEGLVAARDVVADGVDDQAQELIVL